MNDNSEFENNYDVDLADSQNLSADNNGETGKGAAIASMVLGIVSIVAWFFGVGAIVGLVTGIVGLVCAANAKKAGFEGGFRTAGLVCSIIGLVGSAMVYVACVVWVGALGATGAVLYSL